MLREKFDSMSLGVKLVKAYHIVSKENLSLLASGLVYSSLLAFIPAMTFVISILSSFGVLDSFLDTLKIISEEILGENIANQLSFYFNEFTSSASSLGILGAVSFLFTTVLLFNKVHLVVNHIYNTSSNKNFFKRVFSFASFFVLSTLFLGVVFSLNLDVYKLIPIFDNKITHAFKFLLNELGFFIIIFLILLLSIKTIPNTKVRLSCSSLSSLLGALGIYISIKFYKILIQYLVSYSIIYGSFAAVFFMLIYIYIFWYIVLLAIEFAYLLQCNPEFIKKEDMSSPSKQIKDAINLLTLIAKNFNSSKNLPIKEREIIRLLAIKPSSLNYYLKLYKENNIIIETRIVKDKAYSMALPLEKIYVKDILKIIYIADNDEKIDTVGDALSLELSQKTAEVFSSLTLATLIKDK